MSDTCGSCRFWLDEGANKVCRRYPPEAEIVEVFRNTGGVVTDIYTRSFFPSMSANGWCGEYSALSAQTPAR